MGPDRNTLCCVSTTEDVRIWDIGENFGSLRAQFLNLRRLVKRLMASRSLLGAILCHLASVLTVARLEAHAQHGGGDDSS